MDTGGVDFTFDFKYSNTHNDMASVPAANNMAEHGESWVENDMPMQVERVGLQRVVGDVGSIGHEKLDINKYAMELGYREGPKQEQDVERSGGSKTTASGCSTSAPSRVSKKQKTDDGVGLPTPRKLFSVEDESISTDVMREMQRARAGAAATQPATPPRRRRGTGSSKARTTNRGTLRAAGQADLHARGHVSHHRAQDADQDAVLGRDRNTETHRPPAEKEDSQLSGWKPTLVILEYGGNLSRGELVARSHGFLNTLGNDKCKGGFLSQVAWVVRKKVENWGGRDGPQTGPDVGSTSAATSTRSGGTVGVDRRKHGTAACASRSARLVSTQAQLASRTHVRTWWPSSSHSSMARRKQPCPSASLMRSCGHMGKTSLRRNASPTGALAWGCARTACWEAARATFRSTATCSAASCSAGW